MRRPNPKSCSIKWGDVLRAKHYAYRTEKTYFFRIRRFILFHGKKHPADMGTKQIQEFLTHLAVERNVAAATQNHARWFRIGPCLPYATSLPCKRKQWNNNRSTLRQRYWPAMTERRRNTASQYRCLVCYEYMCPKIPWSVYKKTGVYFWILIEILVLNAILSIWFFVKVFNNWEFITYKTGKNDQPLMKSLTAINQAGPLEDTLRSLWTF